MLRCHKTDAWSVVKVEVVVLHVKYESRDGEDALLVEDAIELL